MHISFHCLTKEAVVIVKIEILQILRTQMVDNIICETQNVQLLTQ